MATFTLAHLSDLHLGPLAPLGLRHLNTKRLLGYLNWHRNRKHAHAGETLESIVRDLLAAEPDHIAVSGDLVNIGLPAEYQAALAWLEALGPPERISVVPGNHDIYVRLRRDPGVQRWAGYMRSNPAGAPLMAAADVEPRSAGGDGSPVFPFVRRFGAVAIVGLNTAVPTRPFIAAGRLGPAQIERAGRLLAHLGREKLVRIVMLHHPPLPGQASRTHGLTDAAELASVLEKAGAELVIHGHKHRNMLAWRLHPLGPVPVVGVPSASMIRPREHEALARYNLYRITPAIGSTPAAIEMIGRGLAEPGGPVVEVERRTILPHTVGATVPAL